MNHTLKLVLLLLVAFFIIGAYALTENTPTIYGWAPKKIPLRDFVVNNTKKEQPKEVKIDSTKTPAKKQRILLIGDSMTGLLCYPLAQYADANGHTLDCMTWTSATTRMWDGSTWLTSMMRTVKPTYVMICLGSNELYSRDMESIEKHVRSILKTIGNVPTLWIGPPNWCEDGGINDLLLKIMGKGSYFPSKDLTLERRSDGRHPTKKAADKWMDEIVKWMNNGNSSYPIVMSSPKGKKIDLNLTVISPQGEISSFQKRAKKTSKENANSTENKKNI